MNNYLLYVFSKEERDTLSNLGYTLLKSDEKNNVFVFANEDSLCFSEKEVNAVTSNIMTF